MVILLGVSYQIILTLVTFQDLLWSTVISGKIRLFDPRRWFWGNPVAIWHESSQASRLVSLGRDSYSMYSDPRGSITPPGG